MLANIVEQRRRRLVEVGTDVRFQLTFPELQNDRDVQVGYCP